MQSTSHMLTRLHLETRSLQPDADARWVELVSIDSTRERYVTTLMTSYGFEAPIEAALAMTPGVPRVLPLRPRARSGFIVQDLLSLGLTPSRIARLPQCCQVVPFRDVSEALGWIYVVERATLLHETVRRHLAERLPTVHAWAYLSAYDGVGQERWHELGHAMDYVALKNDSGEQIVAGARAAFATLHDWVGSDEVAAISA